MHLQIRTVPQLSPPDIEAFLTVLDQAGVNLLAAGGGHIESGGEFAIAVEHEREDEVIRLLEGAGYSPRKVEVHTCMVTNEPGQLLACVAEARSANEGTGMVLRDISIGVPHKGGLIPVQIYSDVPWR